MRENNLKIPDSAFGPLLPYIQDSNVTDINFNGYDIWVDDVTRGRYKSDITMTDEFEKTFIMRIKNAVSGDFNPQKNVLEAETENLRVSIIHESISNTGTAISIRKTPPIQRISEESIIESGYCSPEILNFLRNCIHAHMNGVVCGLVGVGKTELVKFLTNYIPASEKVITIEDNLELRYHKLHPEKDCVELKVGELFSYTKAIKTCLRQFPTWIFLSEARSVEVKHLIECFSTGHYGWTTLHTDDVRHIPDRIENMMQDSYAAERTENDIYGFLNVGILIKRFFAPDGSIKRYINQIGVFSRDDRKDTNNIDLLVKDGHLISRTLPESIMHKFSEAGITDPFAYEKGKWDE